jgi:TolA-binding protein
MRALVLAAGFGATLAAALAPSLALAQVERLPSMSRAERQILENNRALELQQQQRSYSQQNQFEINSLRNQLQQQQMFPPPGRGCPTGAVAC